ncbi:MAG: esterase family protein [Anaerolineales bacterium]|nr:esterase family protein [Anaerolineales bacterium]
MKLSRIFGLVIILALTACIGVKPAVQTSLPISSPVEESASPTFLPAATTESTPVQDPVSTLEPISGTSPAVDTPCQEEKGSTQFYSLPVPRTQDEISGRIYTPPCYGANLDQKYPTLYLLHGATETDRQWDDLGIDEYADDLINSGHISPLIIIMPKENSWISLPENPFGDYLVKYLVPWVDTHYQTRVDRKFRAIGGLSRGGNWAVRIGFLNWGMFSSVGVHSSPLFMGDLERIHGWFDVIPESKIPRIYLDVGGDDADLENAAALEIQLTRLGIPHSWHQYPGLHEESYWQNHLGEYLIWYSSGWGDE